MAIFGSGAGEGRPRALQYRELADPDVRRNSHLRQAYGDRLVRQTPLWRRRPRNAAAIGAPVRRTGYVRHGDEWVSLILEAPEFVNQAFRELFAEGVPAVTPMIAQRADPEDGGP